ncbi:hypothetical protein GY45DRAFT_1251017 [Cubamyces sp. BRFM 1775]|nr:hypothetical protein GY45DRAFT_1251017 [Cubamyces sp. BRFM 1775]
MSATTGVIRFPPPPPTRNELTAEQRAKLIRTNNKLGQVLGSTPHVLDLTYRIQRIEIEEVPPKSPISVRNPFRMHGRNRSLPKSEEGSLRAKSPDSVSSGSSGSSRKSTTSIRVHTETDQAWRSPYPVTRARPPLLKLSAPCSSRKPQLETIPGSPPFDQLTSSLDPPTFSIPTDAAMRREKMRRLRRKLGENVPANLVFPSAEDSDSESEEDSPLITTPTSFTSMDWLLVNKPLPDQPHERPLPLVPAGEESPSWAPRRRLFKDRPKAKPSQGAVRLDSIEESAKEPRAEHTVYIGVAASSPADEKGPELHRMGWWREPLVISRRKQDLSAGWDRL